MTYTRFEQDGYWWAEGEHCSLIQTGASNLKYTHHPIAAAQDMSKDRSFRHMSFERLFEAVCERGPTRSGSWRRYNHMDEVVVAIVETRAAVAIHFGVKCLCCEDMAWGAPTPSEWGVSCEDLDAFRKITNAQSDYAHALLPPTQSGIYTSYPVLCRDCLNVARTAKPNRDWSWRYGETNALRGIIAILEHKPQQGDLTQ